MAVGPGRYGSLAYRRQNWGVTGKQCPVYEDNESRSVHGRYRHRRAEVNVTVTLDSSPACLLPVCDVEDLV